ncbi:uncharacterized protein LOC130689695 [Daphnia carinata]|uniref:uncharacterized protein LOC130689695 n=1 Tax=Daphnia carinata TaxID=120202 RepID=UPI00257F3638|nr:uncharacterized protein LOC130689695 [Daphnia carinata]
MLKHLFIVFVVLILQSSSHASNDFDEEDIEAESPQVADSFPRAYAFAPYPWQQWNFQSYQLHPRIQQRDDDEGDSVPHADPRFVTNRCHSAHSYTTTTYPVCTSTWTTTVTVTSIITNSSITTTSSTTESTSTTSITTESTTPTTIPAFSVFASSPGPL